MQRMIKSVAFVGVLGLGSQAALADIAEGDIYLNIENGALTTGLISEDGLAITPGQRVFFAEFGVDVPNVTDEPGFQSSPGGLGSNTTFSFNIRKALRAWDGTSFASIATERVLAQLGPASVLSPESDTLTPGITIPVDAGGAHEHPDWTLQSPASTGVYLLELEFAAGPLTSPHVWILWAQNTDTATNQAAYDWAVANVPAPGAAGLLGVVALAAARRRRA